MKRLLLFILSSFFLAGCTEYAVDMFGSISGIVLDADTNMPLTGVRITISPEGKSQVTSEDGTFSFSDLSAQEYSLTFTKTGYGSLTQKTYVQAGVTSSVQVSMTAAGPVLKVSATELDFANDITTLSFDIENDGDGELEWEISENEDWLECSKSSGTTGRGTSSVVVNVSRTDMDPGTYRGTIVVASNGGSVTLAVTMSVNVSYVNVDPGRLDFGMTTGSAAVSVSNTGSSRISWSAETANAWLVLDRYSGSLGAGETVTVNAIVSREGLSAGEYTSRIVFMAENSEIQVPVTMSVASEEKPVVSMERISEITYNGALLSGTLVSTGTSNVSRYGFCWSTKSNPTVNDFVSDMGDSQSPKAFSGTITNLSSETKYFVRAYAENDSGISYSDKTLSFTTTSYGGGGGDVDEPFVEDYSSADVYSGDYRIVPEIVSCRRSGTTVVLNYTLRNNGLGTINDFRIYPTNSNTLISGGYRTIITDDNYNSYVTSTYKFNGVTQSQNYVLNAVFPDRVKTSGSVTVTGVDRSAGKLTVILGIWPYDLYPDSLSDPRIYFENVPIY